MNRRTPEEVGVDAELNARFAVRLGADPCLTPEAYWVISVAASGIIGNFAYAAVCRLVNRIWTKKNVKPTTLESLVAEEDWEVIRIRHHLTDPAKMVDIEFSDRAELILMKKPWR